MIESAVALHIALFALDAFAHSSTRKMIPPVFGRRNATYILAAILSRNDILSHGIFLTSFLLRFPAPG